MHTTNIRARTCITPKAHISLLGLLDLGQLILISLDIYIYIKQTFLYIIRYVFVYIFVTFCCIFNYLPCIGDKDHKVCSLIMTVVDLPLIKCALMKECCPNILIYKTQYDFM